MDENEMSGKNPSCPAQLQQEGGPSGAVLSVCDPSLAAHCIEEVQKPLCDSTEEPVMVSCIWPSFTEAWLLLSTS